MFEQDYVMRLIKEMVRAMLKLLFPRLMSQVAALAWISGDCCKGHYAPVAHA